MQLQLQRSTRFCMVLRDLLKVARLKLTGFRQLVMVHLHTVTLCRCPKYHHPVRAATPPFRPLKVKQKQLLD